MLDLEAGKQRYIIAIALDAMHHVGHHMAHELMSLFVNTIGIDQDFTDVWLEIISNGADHQRRFLINQECAWGRLACTFNRTPELHQII